jgi:hypothetical protein
MKHAERITPIAAALSALTTLLCCLPLGFAAAAATASLSVAVAALRPWLLGASVVLVAIGFVQVYRGRKTCDRRSRATLAILWMCAAVVLVITLFPQVVATALADFVPSR